MAVMVEVFLYFFGPDIYVPPPTSSPCTLRFLAVSAPAPGFASSSIFRLACWVILYSGFA